MTNEYIIAGLNIPKIYVFNLDGALQTIFTSHTTGIWTISALENILSGGLDPSVIVSDLTTGYQQPFNIIIFANDNTELLNIQCQDILQ